MQRYHTECIDAWFEQSTKCPADQLEPDTPLHPPVGFIFGSAGRVGGDGRGKHDDGRVEGGIAHGEGGGDGDGGGIGGVEDDDDQAVHADRFAQQGEEEQVPLSPRDKLPAPDVHDVVGAAQVEHDVNAAHLAAAAPRHRGAIAELGERLWPRVHARDAARVRVIFHGY